MASSSQSQELVRTARGRSGSASVTSCRAALHLPTEHGGPDAPPAPFGVDAAEEIGAGARARCSAGTRPWPMRPLARHHRQASRESDSGSKYGASYSETTSSNGVTNGSLSLISLRRITPWTAGRSSAVIGRNSMPSGISMSRVRLTGVKGCLFLHFRSDVVLSRGAWLPLGPFV